MVSKYFLGLFWDLNHIYFFIFFMILPYEAKSVGYGTTPYFRRLRDGTRRDDTLFCRLRDRLLSLGTAPLRLLFIYIYVICLSYLLPFCNSKLFIYFERLVILFYLPFSLCFVLSFCNSNPYNFWGLFRVYLLPL